MERNKRIGLGVMLVNIELGQANPLVSLLGSVPFLDCMNGDSQAPARHVQPVNSPSPPFVLGLLSPSICLPVWLQILSYSQWAYNHLDPPSQEAHAKANGKLEDQDDQDAQLEAGCEGSVIPVAPGPDRRRLRRRGDEEGSQFSVPVYTS